MGIIRIPAKANPVRNDIFNGVKLVIGAFSNEKGLFIKLENTLKNKFGEIDFKSQLIPFMHTQYYKKEFGDNLLKLFFSFKQLVMRQKLAAIKRYTNKLESKFISSGNRRINIDPGYLNESKLVLATTKNYSHRIYLEKGIFAEIALFFKGKTFNPWPWTYPDYKSKEYIDIFNHIRSLYIKQLRSP